MKKLTALAAGLALATPMALAEPIVTSDLAKMKVIMSVDVSPDASFAVYTLMEMVKEGKVYKRRSNIWRVDLTDPNSEPHPLTSGARGGSSPTISPDGRTLAFTRRGEGEKPGSQVWLLSLDAPGEARQLTTIESGASNIQWLPDSQAMLVSSSTKYSDLDGEPDWDIERPLRAWNDTKPDPLIEDEAKATPDGTREEIRRWLAGNASKADPSVYNSLSFQGEQGLRPERRASHLYRVDAETGESTQITDGFRSFGGATLSPDGTKLLLSGDPRDGTHPDRLFRNELFIMDADGSNMTTLLSDEELTFNAAGFSDDGSRILYTVASMREEDRWGFQSDLFAANLDASDPVNLTSDWPVSPGGIIADGDRVYFRSSWHGAAPMVSVGLDGATSPETIIDGGVNVFSADVENGVAVASVTSTIPPNQLIMTDASGNTRVLHDPNAEWLAGKNISEPTEHWVTREDGTRVQYWVMPPTNARPGEKYPTCLAIHGGPSVMWSPGSLSMWHEWQLSCAWGYGVVYCNPRGSSGYGFEHQNANFRDWGFGPTGDCLAALDDAAERYDWIDQDNLVVTGGSYAGYLTAFIIGQDHRFKAAVAQRGVYDLETFFGEGNAWILIPYAFGGYPWEPGMREILHRESPFTYVDQIDTPFLIMHASQDLRTGVSQSEMMYRALKVLEKPVEYVRYPGAGHNLSRTGDPNQRMDRLLRILEFFERHVDNDRPAPVIAKPEADKDEGDDDAGGHDGHDDVAAAHEHASRRD